MNVCWLAESCSVRGGGGGGDGGDGDGESSMRNDWWVTKRRMGGREGEATESVQKTLKMMATIEVRKEGARQRVPTAAGVGS